MVPVRKILFLTGDRSEYELIRPVLTEAQNRPGLEVIIAVSGTHLLPAFGRTRSQIEKDGFKIVADIDNLVRSDDPVGRLKSCALLMQGISDVIRHHQPDFIAVLGDREESLVAGTAGVYAQVPVIHLGGGDRADDGNSDNPVRDAVTKLSHVHLAASQASAERIIAIGEEPWRVIANGATGVDRLRQTRKMTRTELISSLGIEALPEPYAVIIQHPLLPEFDQAAYQMRETLEAVAMAGIPAFISRPNSDPGREEAAQIQAEIVDKTPTLHHIGHLDNVAFVNLLRNAAVLIGNSSAGIIEAPFLKLSVINVGNRQLGRECAENVVFVPHDRQIIHNEIQRSLRDKKRIEEVRNCHNPYGDGHAAEKGLDFLSSFLEAPKKLLAKRQSKL